MSARGAVLDAGDGQRCGFKVHLLPLQVTDLGCAQTMPEGEQDHGLVPMRPAVALAASDQPFDLAFRQVLAGPNVGIFGPTWCNFPFYSGWRYDSQDWFCHINQCSCCNDFRQSTSFTESLQASRAD